MMVSLTESDRAEKQNSRRWMKLTIHHSILNKRKYNLLGQAINLVPSFKEKAKMFTTIIIVMLLLISVLMYLIILGGSLNESPFDKELEDSEQIKYIKDYNLQKRRKHIKRKLFYKRIKNKLKNIFHT